MEYGDALETIIRKIVREELAASAPRVAAPPTQTFSEDEFCRRVGISRDTAKRMRDKGRLKFTQIGRRVLYTQDQVAEFLQSNEKQRKRR